MHCSGGDIYSWETAYEGVSAIFFINFLANNSIYFEQKNLHLQPEFRYHWADCHAMFNPYIKQGLCMEMWNQKTFYLVSLEQQTRRNYTLSILV